jgi:hypothetical protein
MQRLGSPLAPLEAEPVDPELKLLAGRLLLLLSRSDLYIVFVGLACWRIRFCELTKGYLTRKGSSHFHWEIRKYFTEPLPRAVQVLDEFEIGSRTSEVVRVLGR